MQSKPCDSVGENACTLSILVVDYFWANCWYPFQFIVHLCQRMHAYFSDDSVQVLSTDHITLIQIAADLFNIKQQSCTLHCFSHVWFCATSWTVARQAPLSMGFSRQEYWSGLPCPPPGDLPDPGIKPASLMSPAFGRQVLHYQWHRTS